MAELHGFILFLLLSSLLLNLFFFFSPASVIHVRLDHLGWSRKAAANAEAVAAVSCSGHGRAYLDGISADGSMPVCECNTCYGGDDCSELDADCSADVDSGNPLFLEPYWMKHASSSAVVISGWHRMGYSSNSKTDRLISVELVKHIRLLHWYVGNAITDDKFIVFGVGSTQLLNALVHALSPDSGSSPPARVVATVPFYPMYEFQTELFDSEAYKWSGFTSNWSSPLNSSTTDVIEFVTSPNNPDGKLMKPVLHGSSVINDHAYYWPHYTPIPAPADEDVMVFTMSKMSGHAGSRFGWAFIKDQRVYEKATVYLRLNVLGTSHDTHLRMLMIMKSILAQKRGEEGDIFRFGRQKMTERWRTLSQIVSSTKRFSLQSLSPQYCTYFNKTRGPSPAYAWLKCEVAEEEDCNAVLEAGGIISRGGATFRASKRYTRLSLIKTDDDFQLLVQRLRILASAEMEGVEIM